MTDSDNKKINQLRERIPIGQKHATNLLVKTGGDLDAAENIYKEEMVALAIKKTGISKEVVIRHLAASKYDVGLAIRSIDEERYSKTELILRKYKNKKSEALNYIVLAIGEKYQLKQNFWLDFEDLKNLPCELYPLVVIVEWMNFEGWEGYSASLSFHLGIITEQLAIIGFEELSQSLKKASQIQEQIYKDLIITNETEAYENANYTLIRNREYTECENYYNTHTPALIAALNKLVTNNIDKLP